MAAKGEAGWLALLVLGLLVLLGVALYPRPQSAPPRRTSSALQPPETRDGARGQPSAPPSVVAPFPGIPIELEQRRQRVLTALEQSQATNREGERGASPAGEAPGPAETSSSAVQNDDGSFPQDAAVVERALLPLVQGCYEQVRERDARLAGTLVLTIMAHAGPAGGIIESVEPSAESQLRDEGLLDCVRRSAYGIELSPSARSGRHRRALHVQLGAPPAAGAPSRP